MPGTILCVLRPSFPIRTARLLLRPFEDGDFDALFAMQSREDVTRYLPWTPRSADEVREMLDRLKKLTGIHEESEGLRVAGVLPESGEVVGDFSIWRRSAEHGLAEIGFVTHPDHQRQGYATEAAAELLRLAFEVADLNRVVASADARNIGSIRVMQRLGMRQEAYFHQNELLKGEWTDEVVYAILASEWRSARATPPAAR